VKHKTITPLFPTYAKAIAMIKVVSRDAVIDALDALGTKMGR
jgi:hypothetical protein